MEFAALIPLLQAALGFAVATYIVFTAPASRRRRIAALAGVAVAAFVGVAIVIVGIVNPLFGLTGAWLVPVLASIVLRQAWLR